MCWRQVVSNNAIVSAVCSMTFLQQFDWGLVTDGSPQPVLLIVFAAALSTTDSMTINELIGHLSSHLPTTKIRVFRVPSRHHVAPVSH